MISYICCSERGHSYAVFPTNKPLFLCFLKYAINKTKKTRMQRTFSTALLWAHSLYLFNIILPTHSVSLWTQCAFFPTFFQRASSCLKQVHRFTVWGRVEKWEWVGDMKTILNYIICSSCCCFAFLFSYLNVEVIA